MSETPTHSRRILRAALLALLSIVLILLFYIAVVMGQPQTDRIGSTPSAPSAQPLPEPLSSTIILEDVGALDALAGAFPAPVMYAGSKNLIFLSGECADVPFEDGVARIVTLTYRTADFDTLTLRSIYPARALSLLGRDGRRFSGISADTMAGMKYVAMEDAGTIRLHAQSSEALYVLTTPLVSDGVLDQWTNALQLHRPQITE